MNPWAVRNLNEFLFFCCPECDVKKKDMDDFLLHALTCHPAQSKLHVADLYSSIVELPESLKENRSAMNEESNPINKRPRMLILIEEDRMKSDSMSKVPVIGKNPECQENQEAKNLITVIPSLTKTMSQTVSEMDMLVSETIEIESEKENAPIDGSNVMQEVEYDVQETSVNTELDPLPPQIKKKVKKSCPGDTFVCSMCGKVFTKKKYLTKHEEICNKESGEPIECEKCSYVTNRKGLMEAHKERVHQLFKKKYSCEICGQMFATLHRIKQHQEFKHVTNEKLSEIPCHCHKCEEKFENSVDLNEHLKYCLEDADKKNLKCCFCQSENWLSTIAVERHTAEDHQSLSKVCEKCNTVLTMITTRKHACEARSKKKHKCPSCDKDFNNFTTCLRHRLIEHNDTSVSHYTCTYCDKKFIGKARLDNHVNVIHTKKQTYKCPQCKFTTLHKDWISRHIQIVHEKKTLAVCPYGCGKEFTLKAYVYRNHLKKCHLKPNTC